MQGERVLSGTHDMLIDYAFGDLCQVYVMADVDDDVREITYTTYAITSKDYLFYDSFSNHWSQQYVVKAYEKGLMKGMGYDMFGVFFKVSRSQAVTVLWRLAGEPTPSEKAETTYPDLVDGTWYTEAVKWATEAGIVEGLPDGRFAPTQRLTRAELAVMLYRYAEYIGVDTSARAELSQFYDAGEADDWCREAFEWCVAVGIINGRRESHTARLSLSPNYIISREEMAAVACRCDFEK